MKVLVPEVVMLSVLEVPRSEAVARSGVDGDVGTVRSIVIDVEAFVAADGVLEDVKLSTTEFASS